MILIFVNDLSIQAINKERLFQECVHWDIHTNSWTTSGCSLISTNETHTSCTFNYISTYTVIEVEKPGTSMEVVATLVASLMAIFAAASTVICCIQCWKKIKVSCILALILFICCTFLNRFLYKTICYLCLDI